MDGIDLPNPLLGGSGVPRRVIHGIVVAAVEVDINGKQEDLVFFTVIKMLDQTFDQPMLIALVLPSVVYATAGICQHQRENIEPTLYAVAAELTRRSMKRKSKAV